MERVLLRKLIEWKEKPDRKPLLLKGVRRVGKTHLLREFGRRCYDDFVYRKKYAPKYSVKTSMKIETNVEEVLNIPLYLISGLKRFVQ